ncbi:unnamed protein product, partial [marine sediment metagenome]
MKDKETSGASTGTSPWKRYLPVWLTVLAGVGLSLAVFAMVRAWETREIRAGFLRAAEDRAGIIKGKIEANLRVFDSIRSLHCYFGNVARGQFEQFVESHLSHDHNIRTVQWVPFAADLRPAEHKAIAGLDAAS